MTDTYRLFNIDYHGGLRFSFISSGVTDIIKVVDYSIVGVKSKVIKANPIFNFGFGDFDFETGAVKDEVKSANGDVRKVFYSSLETIPIFFQKYPEAAIMITGSDSKHDFQERCFLTCTKRCEDPSLCRNKDQRINVYRMYLNKNFDVLNQNYNFFGGIDGTIEPYQKQKKYKSVFVVKK